MQRDLSMPLGRSTPRVAAVRLVGLAGVLALAGCAALWIDVPVAHWLHEKPLPSVVVKLCDLAEVFANAIGAALIVLTIAVLDPAARRCVPRILATSLGAGVLADSLKVFVARWRPRDFDFRGGVGDTFIGWLPLLHNASEQQGFPSAHAAVGAGLAVVLAWLYPRGAWWFGLLAVLAGCQRLVAGAHFPSDVLWGAAIGILMATACVGNGPFAKAFDRFERRKGKFSTASGRVAPSDVD